MFRDDTVVGSWFALVDRLDQSQTMARWAGREPVLAAAGGVAGLRELTAPGGDPGRADALLGGLVRLAAVDGGDDPDAVLVLLHLLAPGVRALAGRLADLDPAGDMVAVVVGQLAVEVRAFPWRRRHRAYAANLLLDTRRAVLRDYGIRRGVAAREVPVGGDQLWWEAALSAGTATCDAAALADGAGEGPRAELADLLRWATRRNVAPAEDLWLVWQLEQLAGYGAAAGPRLAAELGVHERTIRRRQQRTLAALRAAAPAYVAAVQAA